MKISDNLRLAVVFVAFAGMLSPIATFGAPPTDAPVRKAVSVQDTKLAAGDALVGKVVDAQGNAVAGTVVSIHRGTQHAAQATTNAKGEFQVAGLTGGVYQVKTQGVTANYRVWTAQAAPPVATDGILLVDYTSSVTRGQCASGGCASGGFASAPAYGGGAVDMGYAGGGEVVYGDGGCGGGGGAGYADGGYVDGGYGGDAGYGGGEVIYGDGGCGAGAGYPVDAGYGYGGGGGGFGLGGGGGGFLGFLSSPWVIGAGVAAAIAIPLALDDDDDNNANAGNGNGAGNNGGGAAS